MKQVAVYGKGGIGKSTITANLSAAMAAGGTRVLQIGCDPKHDSTKLLLGGTSQATVLQLLRERGDDLRREDVVLPGFGGVDCVEAGGPEPGVGCAGRGILSMAKALDAVGLDKGGYDVVAYDVLGDVVCGGFSVPMRAEYADEVLIVSSGEIMSLYAANNIARGLLRFGGKLGGIVGNARDVPHEEALLCALAAALGTELVAMVPRDPLFREAELARRTVVEHAPDSERAAQFRALAERVAGPARTVVPTPLDEDDFERLIFRVAGGEDPDVREAPGTFRTPATDARPPAVEPDFGAYLDAPDVPVSKAVRERAPRFSCALQGAFAVLAHVGGAVTVMHSPAGCAHPALDGAKLTARGAAARGLRPAPGHAVPPMACTNLVEADSVFGGEGKLEAEVRRVAAAGAQAVFVVTSCPSAIVGDDPAAVAARCADLGIPVVPVASDGVLRGDFAQGVTHAYAALVDRVVLDGPAPEPDPDLVALVGEEPLAISADEDLDRLRPVLAALGLRPGGRFVRATDLAALRGLRAAPVAVRMADTPFARAAQDLLADRTGMRCADAPAPVGLAGTLAWAAALAQATDREVPASLRAQLTAGRDAALARLRPALAGRRVLLGVFEHDVRWVAELCDELGADLVGAAVLPSATHDAGLGLDAGVPRLEVADADGLVGACAEAAPDLLLANYLPRALPAGQRAAALPLCPPLGATGTLREAAAWARALRAGREGWRADLAAGPTVEGPGGGDPPTVALGVRVVA